MEIYIGVDGGGTKTEATAIDGDGKVLSQFIGGSTNPSIVTFEGAVQELENVLDGLLVSCSTNGSTRKPLCRSICLGMSGISTTEEQKQLSSSLERYQAQRRLALRLYLRSEAEISLTAALGRQDGVLAIAGTGSNNYGITRNGEVYRVGGWGHLLGDEGSGYQIGLLTLKSVMRSYEGLLPPTQLTERITDFLQLQHITELKAYIYHPSITKRTIASFARLCIEAAEDGDSVAAQLMKEQAQELAHSTAALIRKHDEFPSSNLVGTGSIFRYSRLFRSTFQGALRQRFPLLQFPEVRWDRSPAHGAALLARQYFQNGV